MYKVSSFSLFVLVFLISCKKSGNSSNDSLSVPANIFMAGSEDIISTIPSTYYSYAKFWKDGEGFNLTATNSFAEARSVFVSGTDVYLAGFERAGNVTVAKIWKNGNPTSITSGVRDAQLYSVYVSGLDVYVCGSEFNGKYYEAKLWKNGVATKISGGVNSDAYAFEIKVQGKDVFVLFEEYGQTPNAVKLWKNGTIINISTANIPAYGYSLAIDGNDVYISGTELEGNSYKPIIWKNGQRLSIPLTSGYVSGSARSIFALGSDIYVLVEENDNTKYNYRVLKNGLNLSTFSVGVNNGDFSLIRLFVHNKDIYVCGNEDLNGKVVPVYWKNNSKVRLSPSATSNVKAFSLFVK